MFVIWGALHGGALMVHHAWQKLDRPLPASVAWALTFLFVNMAWVFFRAENLADAMRILSGMVDFASALPVPVDQAATSDLAWAGYLSDVLLRGMPAAMLGQLPIMALIASCFFVLSRNNTTELLEGSLTTREMVAGAVLFALGLNATLVKTSSVFLYFNF
jgi:hypothetical protein